MDVVLTKYQRLSLLNQYKILQKFAKSQGNDDEAKEYERLEDIVANGYVEEYEELFSDLQDEFSKEESLFVWDTLRMYSAIYLSYKNLKNPAIDKFKIYFWGFDSNEEWYYMDFCKHALINLKCFDELTEGNRVDFNSHSRRWKRYREMLDKWENIGEKTILTEEEIKYLIS